MNHLSLCTGYGGIDLALSEVFGAETVAVADIDKGACKILAHRYPNVPNLGDITATDWSQWVGKVDVISGGTPCQDLSHAGRRAGMTEGTRSNLWVAMRESISVIRPSLVVWENVRGAYSACADSELGRCPRCVDPDSGVGHAPYLRALGRVLGDLSSLGYDAFWYGLRASDVGAAHHRYRVFVFAVRANSDSGGRECEWWLDAIRRHAHRPGRADGLRSTREPAPCVSLPSPRTSDANRAGQHGDGGPDLRTVVTFLPTTMTSDTKCAGPADEGRNSPQLRAIGALLQDWREYEPAIRRQEAAFGRPAPLPTEVSPASKRKCPIHGINAEGRPGEELRDVRETVDSQEVCERTTGRSQRVPEAAALLPELREHAEGGDAIGARISSEAVPEGDVRRVRGQSVIKREEAARPPQGPELGERRSEQPDDAVRLMPSETALAGGSRAALSDEPVACTCKHRLSAEFSSWLMGCPDGWITDTPGITRNEALKAAGNGVVPAQCAAAARRFLSDFHLLAQEES